MKKTLCLVLTLVMLVGAFSAITVNAEGSSTMDDALLLHWDFEGDTLEEQLSNKAENGLATDSLTFTTDGESSEIKDGIAKIGSPYSESLAFDLNAEKGVGTKLINTVTTSYTLYIRFTTSGENKGTTTSPFYVAGSGTAPLRVYLLAGGFLRYRLNNENANDKKPKDDKLVDGAYVDIAITVTKNNNGTLTANYYQSFDGWNAFICTETATSATTGNKALSTVASFLFGGGNAWGQNEDLGKNYHYDDIRIYNRALTEAEIYTINKQTVADSVIPEEDEGDEGADNGSQNVPNDNGDNKTTEHKVNTAPSTDTAAETTADTTATEATGGCGAAVMGMALIPVAVAAGVATLTRKRKEN